VRYIEGDAQFRVLFEVLPGYRCGKQHACTVGFVANGNAGFFSYFCRQVNKSFVFFVRKIIAARVAVDVQRLLNFVRCGIGHHLLKTS
jgi:hypothetical protein